MDAPRAGALLARVVLDWRPTPAGMSRTGFQNGRASLPMEEFLAFADRQKLQMKARSFDPTNKE
jgi:hypothetical protein